MSAKDIVLAVALPLLLAEFGPWCGWLAGKLLPWAAQLRYSKGDRASIRAEEWCDDLRQIPGQLSKLVYSLGQLTMGAAVAARRSIGGKASGSRTRQVVDTTWSSLFPQGRLIYYEGDDPVGFAKQMQAEFGLRPDLDPQWGMEFDEDEYSFISYAFHCPTEYLDVIYGSGRFRMGS